jgi:excisionase family DNA binding protein
MSGKRYLDAKEEAARIGCSVRTLERACADEGFPFIRFGRLRRFDPDLTDQYLAARTYNGRAAERSRRAA